MPRSGHTRPRSAARRQSLWIFAAIGAVILLAVAASALFATRLEGPGKALARRLDTGWSYLQDGAFLSIPRLPCTLEVPGETLILRHNLTEQELHSEYVLTFRTRYASIRVWAGDALIYEAAQGSEHALGSMWHFIPMSRCAGADLLTVELFVYGGGSYPLESVLLDTPGAIQYTLIQNNAGPIFFGSICLLLTLIMILCAVVLARWKSPMYLPLLSLALFMFLSGLWILLDSKITTLAGGNYALSYFLSYAAFYLLPVPYLLYIRLMLDDCRRCLGVLIWAILINAGLCMTLHILGLVQLRHTAILVHALIVLAVPVSTWAFWRSVVRRRERKLRFTFFGIMSVYVCGLVSIVLYHLDRLQAANSTPLYILGLSILLIGMTADAIASFGRFWRQKESSERYRRLAVEDSMTALGNRNAFQLYLSNLLERPPERLAFVVFDVDDLKRINDQLGHHVGDQAIYIAAQCIRAAVDTFGSCYRIGGDEFAAVVTGKAVAKIPEILSRFTREVEIHWNMQLPSSGVSYGWSSASFSPKTPLTAERLSQLRAEADQSLYRLKQDRKEGKMDGPAV